MSRVMVLLVVVDLLITLVSAVSYRDKPSARLHILADWLIMMVFPFGGILVVLILEYHKPEKGSIMLESAQSGHWIDSEVKPEPIDIRSETNIAPLQDILLVADYDKRREVLLDILKTDILAYANYVQTALQNDDKETVHYAATGLQHIRQKLDTRLHELSTLYQADPGNLQVAAAYADLLEQYLSSFNLDTATRQQYVHASIDILGQLVKQTDLTRISRLIDHLLSIGQYQQVRHYCNILLTEYPDSETKYLVLMKSYFLMKDKHHFDEAFSQFRASDISFSDEALNIIRLWLGAIK